MRTSCALLALALLLLATGCRSSEPGFVDRTQAIPPPPPEDGIFFEPRVGEVWVEGRWVNPPSWQWSEGRWTDLRTGYVYQQGHWGRDGDSYVWSAGRWVPKQKDKVWERGHWERQADGKLEWVSGRWQATQPDHRWVPGRWERDAADELTWREGHWEPLKPADGN
jgi:hypothetical protein